MAIVDLKMSVSGFIFSCFFSIIRPTNAARETALTFQTKTKIISQPLLFQRQSGAHPPRMSDILVEHAVASHFWGVFSTNIPLCDSFSGVK